MGRKPSTDPIVVREADQLVAAWHRKFGNARGHRKPFADLYGVNESYIGLMMKAYAPINSVWKSRFSQYLDMPIADIWPDFKIDSILNDTLPPNVVRLLQVAMQADPELVHAAEILLSSRSR
jgi:hypothetical protein